MGGDHTLGIMEIAWGTGLGMGKWSGGSLGGCTGALGGGAAKKPGERQFLASPTGQAGKQAGELVTVQGLT